MRKIQSFISVWISDTHLGSCGTQIDSLNTFLSELKCKNLYLNGDIFDQWLIQNSQELKIRFTKTAQALHNLCEQGTDIYFLQGNHDNASDAKLFCNKMKHHEELVYTSLTGKKYLIFHGDALDPTVKLRTNSMALWSSKCFNILLRYQKKTEKKRNLSKPIKKNIKKFINFVCMYEHRLHKYCIKKDVDGVICGHSHQPQVKQLKSKEYYNSGDWIDHCTYIAENQKGEIKLYKWQN